MKNIFHVTLSLVVLLLSTFPTSEGDVKCYVCGVEGGLCKSSFYEDDAVVKNCKKSCRKVDVVHKKRKERIVIRDCGDFGVDECSATTNIYGELESVVSGTQCYCNTDLCNHTPALEPSKFFFCLLLAISTAVRFIF